MIQDSEIALKIGKICFAQSVDKAGQPYWGHCLRVAGHVRAAGASDAAIAAALLHDVVEDGLSTIEDLESAGISTRAISLIGQLTRPKETTYEAYVAAIAASGDRELILIKLADNADNSDPARIALLPPNVAHRADRYAAARAVLIPALTKLDADKLAD